MPKKMQIHGMDQQIWLRHQINILDCEMASAERLIEEYKLFGLPTPQAYELRVIINVISRLV